MPTLIVLALGLLTISTALAEKGFTFTKNKVSMTVAPAAEKVTVPYYFVNKTGRVLTIAKYDSACSCLSAKVKGSKLVYKPGEKGEIKVEFALGSFSGFVEKTVLLWTADDPEQAPSSVLTVALTIPQLFAVTPKDGNVTWEQGGTKETKVVKFKVNGDKPVQIINHSGTNDNFVYQITTIREGLEYNLEITPKDVSLPALGMIRLSTDSSIPRYQRQMAFACVRRKVAAPVAPQPVVP